MRIVGGTLKGRRLNTPKTDAIRPTTDRTREALFNVLTHGIPDFEFKDATVLDLFAGSGALGIEAISRGARFALFVEQLAEARGLIRKNVEDLALAGVTKIFRRDATKLGAIQRFDPFDLVFLDPPYDRGLGEKALASCREGGWLASDAVCVFEESASAEIKLPAGFDVLDERAYGDTQIMILRHIAT